MNKPVCALVSPDEELPKGVTRMLMTGAYLLYRSGRRKCRFKSGDESLTMVTRWFFVRHEDFGGLLFDAKLRKSRIVKKVQIIVSKEHFLSAPPEKVKKEYEKIMEALGRGGSDLLTME